MLNFCKINILFCASFEINRTMKFKVIVNLPFSIDDKEFVQSKNVYMDVAQIPHPGDIIRTYHVVQ